MLLLRLGQILFFGQELLRVAYGAVPGELFFDTTNNPCSHVGKGLYVLGNESVIPPVVEVQVKNA